VIFKIHLKITLLLIILLIRVSRVNILKVFVYHNQNTYLCTVSSSLSFFKPRKVSGVSYDSYLYEREGINIIFVSCYLKEKLNKRAGIE